MLIDALETALHEARAAAAAQARQHSALTEPRGTSAPTGAVALVRRHSAARTVESLAREPPRPGRGCASSAAADREARRKRRTCHRAGQCAGCVRSAAGPGRRGRAGPALVLAPGVIALRSRRGGRRAAAARRPRGSPSASRHDRRADELAELVRPRRSAQGVLELGITGVPGPSSRSCADSTRETRPRPARRRRRAEPRAAAVDEVQLVRCSW